MGLPTATAGQIPGAIKTTKFHVVARMIVTSVEINPTLILAVDINFHKLANHLFDILKFILIDLHLSETVDLGHGLDFGLLGGLIEQLDESGDVVFGL